jgi:hypothetical protein
MDLFKIQGFFCKILEFLEISKLLSNRKVGALSSWFMNRAGSRYAMS